MKFNDIDRFKIDGKIDTMQTLISKAGMLILISDKVLQRKEN